jgi:protein kinase X
MDKKKGGLKKIALEDYSIKQTVGTGSFGRVKLVLHNKENKYYAMKILKKVEIIKLKQVDHILSEVSILNLIDHPFLVRMTGITQNERYLYIVLEYVQGGELFTYLRTVQSLRNEDAIFYSAQVILMFEYLHSKNIVYRDLKPENLLIDAQGYLKLTDFGFAKVIEGRTYTLCGTPEYLAPEILLQKGHGKPVDWWCLGILIYEMLVGIDPFSDEEPMAVYQNILKGKLKFPSTFDSDAKSLVKHLLVADLGKRYGNLKGGVNDIKEHRWFNNFDWNKLLHKELKSPWVPKIKNEGDTSNYSQYPDSPDLPKPLKSNEDPFINW